MTYGANFNKYAHEAETIEVTSSGVELNTDFLDKITNSPSKGVLLFEGAGSSTSKEPLILEVWDDSEKVYEITLPMNISGVEDMYRHVNLVNDLDAAENQTVTVADRTGEPANLPDSLSNGDNFVFVHGYNVSQEAARGWQAEVFKRLYQSGSRTKFTGVTWHGDVSPNYHKAVINAMVTSENLDSQLSFLTGEVTIGAHSARKHAGVRSHREQRVQPGPIFHVQRSGSHRSLRCRSGYRSRQREYGRQYDASRLDDVYEPAVGQ